MPTKRGNAKVSRRSRDNGKEEAFIISEDHDSLISSNNDNDISDDDNAFSGGEEEDAGDEENASPNKSVARPRAAIRGKAIKKKSRATPKEMFEDLVDQFMDDPDKMLEYARRVPQLEPAEGFQGEYKDCAEAGCE
jgi:hypothetical protein